MLRRMSQEVAHLGQRGQCQNWTAHWVSADVICSKDAHCCAVSSSSSFTQFFENAFQPICENGTAKGDPFGARRSSTRIVADVT
jgi:hypothetical protein